MNVEEYEVMYRMEDLHWWYRGLRSMIAKAWAAYGPPEGAAVLDLGCGTGANAAFLGVKATVTALDISAHAMDRCRTRGIERRVRASALALPFANERFSGALIMDLLSHRAVPNKQAPLAEARRVLRPGGVLFINVPAYQWLYSSHDELVHTDKRFTRPELVSLIEGAGFEPLWTTHWNSLLLPPIVALRLWRKLSHPRISDLGHGGESLFSRVFSAVLAIERAAMALAPLPCGLSIFAVARKS